MILHGLSYFSYDRIEATDALAADREVVAMDLRGFGESDWSPARDYRLETVEKCCQAGDQITVCELAGDHGLAGDNPAGMINEVKTFLEKLENKG